MVFQSTYPLNLPPRAPNLFLHESCGCEFRLAYDALLFENTRPKRIEIPARVRQMWSVLPDETLSAQAC
jgi:hypothetical protein